ncbi:transcriptional regulator [Amycolatopsis antarctica]|uniref:Transcriptional regulator n=1 Tax=Amycolatopsis antarctica TaxID=1854586 RepID=A0A263DCB6_9PSEU|nr:helix-turn-helix transcriptional regulator [Amycolatopsis antarctica]OZM75025.1 transcriptional regulator [Amycolatopsis antarctica]
MRERQAGFGAELRRVRVAAGISLSQLADAVHYSKGYLSKIENGHKALQSDLARRCDAELGTGGVLSALLTSPAPERPLPDTPDDGQVWAMNLAPDGRSWFRPMARREALALGGGAALGFGLGTAPAAQAERNVAIKVFRDHFDQLRVLGQSASPGVVLPGLVAQTHTLRSLGAQATATERREILRLSSRFAEYAGWMTQESGDERGAVWWTDRAVEMAEAGGDSDLAGYALVRRALVSFYRDDAKQTIRLARQAQERGAAPPRISGLAAQQEAQGYALAGDYNACMRSLDRARRLLQRAAERSDPATPILGTSNLDDPAAMANGWCLLDLGRPREAADELDRQVTRIPDHALRTQARYGVRRALAHASINEIESACDIVSSLFGAVSVVGSATVETDLRRLLRTLSRHQTHPAVREIYPRIVAELTVDSE